MTDAENPNPSESIRVSAKHHDALERIRPMLATWAELSEIHTVESAQARSDSQIVLDALCCFEGRLRAAIAARETERDVGPLGPEYHGEAKPS